MKKYNIYILKSSVYSLCRFRMSTIEKIAKHKPSGYAWSLICTFYNTKNKPYFYRREDCIEKFCKDLKDLRTEIINF